MRPIECLLHINTARLKSFQQGWYIKHNLLSKVSRCKTLKHCLGLATIQTSGLIFGSSNSESEIFHLVTRFPTYERVCSNIYPSLLFDQSKLKRVGGYEVSNAIFTHTNSRDTWSHLSLSQRLPDSLVPVRHRFEQGGGQTRLPSPSILLQLFPVGTLPR